MTTFLGKPINIIGDTIKVGDKAREFVAVTNDLDLFKLSNISDAKAKVIIVAPSIDTSVCSSQTVLFDGISDGWQNHIEFIVVTVDLPFAQQRFSESEKITNLTMVSDYQIHDFGLKYGFLIEDFNLLTRGVVIIDKNNVVKYVEYVEEVTSEIDYQSAVEVLKTL